MEANNDNITGGSDLPTIDTPPTDASQPAVAETNVSVAESNSGELQDQNTTDSQRSFAPREPSTTVRQDHETFAEFGKDFKHDGTTLPLPPETQDRIEEALEAIPNVALADTPAGQEWAAILNSSKYTVSYANVFARTTVRDGSMFMQGVPSERGVLGAAAPSLKETEGSKLTGERGVLRVRAIMGLGSLVQVPLWHSGFWITLKAPSEAALLELNRRLVEEKISLGRATYGLAFANNSVFWAGWLFDFVMAHVYDCTLKDSTDLRSKISSLDLPILTWGLACVIWPRGFQYARSLLDAQGVETKVVREKLNVGKLLWTDTKALTPWQVTHMANRFGNNMTPEMLERYKSEFTRGQPREIELQENLKVTLRVPTVDQYLTSGQKWINNIVAMVDRAFGLPPTDDVRDQYIMDQGKATNMRQFAHWVETINPGSHIIDDVDTIDQSFDALSSDDEIRNAFFKAVREFMEDSTVSIVGVPVADENEKSSLPRFPHLLPLDVLSTFFILLVQKTERIQMRG